MIHKINSWKICLYLITKYKSVWEHGHPGIFAEIGSDEHDYEYALLQIKNKTINGFGIDILGKDVLEIGCGHGGICLFMSMNGAKSVVGIDVSDEALATARKIATQFEKEGRVRKGTVRYEKSFAEKIDFANESFDIIIADNVFEHVNDLTQTLKECKRLLKPKGIIYAPNFPSIYSSGGPHLKYGSKIPWLHIFFTEKSICEAVYQRAIKYPELKLFDYYGGLINNPKTFKDVRKYKDLNYITHKKFKKAVKEAGLKIIDFYSSRPLWGIILIKLFPFLKSTKFDDILSYGTMAKLK